MLALIVDPDDQHATQLQTLLEACGFHVLSFQRPSQVPHDLESLGLLFLSLDCHGEDGLQLMAREDVAEAIEIILMNDVDDTERVSDGIRRGASYYFQKPFNVDFISDLAQDVLAEIESQTATATTNAEDQRHIGQFGLLRGSSRQMLKLFRTMRKVAQQDTNVFVIGETGVGKDLVAQSVHMLGERSSAPFVPMNCAAVPSELFESELFGHEKGSFSGAVAQHQGFFERAHNGTLFLDEITEMPLDLQAKLLRVLDGKSFRRVGGVKDIAIDVRVLASSNRIPDAAVSEGYLREDLYFRLANLVLRVPPLRKREGDIIGLARHFLGELNLEYNTDKQLSDAARELIAAHEWPGNVREMRSCIERAYILSNDGLIQVEDIGELENRSSLSADLEDALVLAKDSTIAEAEQKLIHAALDACDGNKTRAAESLGISVKTLYNRLKAYGLDTQKKEDF